jgi:MFS superfamily sulfate permease-like transporter
MVYALFGSSKQLAVGPVSVISMLIGNGIRAMVPGSENIDNPSKPQPEYVETQALYNKKVICGAGNCCINAAGTCLLCVVGARSVCATVSSAAASDAFLPRI